MSQKRESVVTPNPEPGHFRFLFPSVTGTTQCTRTCNYDKPICAKEYCSILEPEVRKYFDHLVVDTCSRGFEKQHQ
mgnify:CR=1 FL=1